jgi:hypothetical protein
MHFNYQKSKLGKLLSFGYLTISMDFIFVLILLVR